MVQQIKKTLPLALPIIIGQVGQMLMGFIDSAMVGRIGAEYLAASAFANIVFNIPYIFLIGVTISVSVLTSQNFGARRTQECGKALWNGFVVSGIMTTVVLIVMFSISNHLILFRQPVEVTLLAKPFYELLVWSFIPLCIFQCLKQFSDGLGLTQPAAWCLLIGVLVNVIINYFLIYGNGGFPRLELVGAGIGTLFARTISSLLLLTYILRADKYKPYLTRFKESISWGQMKLALKIGLPSGAQFLFEVGAFAGAGLLVGWVGTSELAAHQIALQLASMTFMFALGMSMASSVRVGQAFGAQDYVQVREIGKSSIVFVTAGMGFFAFVFMLLRNYLPTIFVHEMDVIHFASQLIIIAALFQMFDGIQAVCVGLLRGVSDVRVPTILTFIAYWVIGLPMAYVLAFKFDLRQIGVWIGLAFSLLVSSTLLSTRFFHLLHQHILSSLHPTDLIVGETLPHHPTPQIQQDIALTITNSPPQTRDKESRI